MATRQFAIVTGASSGIGLELARTCVQEGFDLLIVADEPDIELAANELRGEAGGGSVEAVQADLSTIEGVDKLYRATKGRPVDVLMANAGRGLGRAFLDQDVAQIRWVIDTNISRLRALCRGAFRPSTTAPRRFPFRSRCGRNCAVPASPSPA